MTELERELRLTLKAQEELFKTELESVTAKYESNLSKAMRGYQKIIEDQKIIIDQQSKTLSEYEKASKSIRIRLDDQQVTALTEQVTVLAKRLDGMEEQDKDLVKQLNNVLAKL